MAKKKRVEAPAGARAIEIRCSYSKLADPVTLKLHPRNPNTHSAAQVAMLAKIIEHQGWRSPIVVSDRSGFVVAGNGRLLAALQAGLKQVPVDYQKFATDDDELAHLLADNKIAELAELDFEQVSALLREIKLDLSLTGFPQHEVDMLLAAQWTPGPSTGPLIEKGKDGSVTVKFTSDQWKKIKGKIDEDDPAKSIVDLLCKKK